jgi:hypothetical protein
MPRDRIARELEERGIGPEALLLLQRHFNVSLQALLCRVSGLFRGRVFAILWRQGYSRAPMISWAGPPRHYRVILCNRWSPVDAAFTSAEAQTGHCELFLDGERTRWEVGALRLRSNAVLSVFRRKLKKLRRFMPTIPEGLTLRSSQYRQYPMAFHDRLGGSSQP